MSWKRGSMFGKFSVNPTLGRLGVYGIFIGFMSVVMYPIMIGPMINSDHYKKIQEKTRAGIDQSKVQPGNMNVWTDPFDRKKD